MLVAELPVVPEAAAELAMVVPVVALEPEAAALDEDPEPAATADPDADEDPEEVPVADAVLDLTVAVELVEAADSADEADASWEEATAGDDVRTDAAELSAAAELLAPGDPPPA